MQQLKRHFLSFLLMGIACYTALALFGQGGEFWSALRAFPVSYLPLMLGLAFLNYLLRYVRWYIYLRASEIHIDYWKSFCIFMAGLTMTVTPGKVGEALKAHLLKREGDKPLFKGLSIVFMERLTDLMGVVILVGLGLGALPIGLGLVLLGMGVCFLLVFVFVHPALYGSMVWLLKKVPGMSGRSEWFSEMYRTVRCLMTLRFILIALLISCIAWFSECLVLYFALSACEFQIGFLPATFIYALSTLAGALSILPGGLFATEASMTGMLLLSKLGRNQAALVTFIVRLCTLWFAVFVGITFFYLLLKSTKKEQ